MERRRIPLVWAALLLAWGCATTAPQGEDGFVPLFDGRSLEGWKARGGKAAFRVEDGSIVGTTAPEGPNTFLCTERTFDTFELRLEVKCDRALNSGIQVRSRAYEKETPQRSDPKLVREAGSVYGPQVEITSNGDAGRIWDEGRDRRYHDPAPSEAARAAYRPGEWNRFRIVAQGNRLRTWVNDVPVADVPLDEDPVGFIGLQVHRVKPDEGPYRVLWRRILLREISVNPGINKTFESPKPAEFVERWEREGREVYDKREEIAAGCGLKPGMAVADVGAGTGLFTRIFARAVGEKGKVYAVDIAESFVRHVEKTSREAGLSNVKGVVCAPDDAGLLPGSIDLAFLCDTYHHFEHPHKTLRSIRSALRDGGRLVVVEFVREEGKSSEWVLGHVRAGQAVFTREILACGFRQVEEKKLLKENYMLVFAKE
ncbi:MAG TPA: family 16 glycoside hydrolase [Planctomycetota bacterium]|nr:family 16 glycoside hydrolase [Planctomycetota bacterium]